MNMNFSEFEGVQGFEDVDFVTNGFEAEDLQMIRNVQKPDWDWPKDLKCPPWRIQPQNHPEWRVINRILQASLDFQRSKSPPFCLGYVNHDNPLSTSSLMHLYLKAYLAKVGDNDSKLEWQFGVTRDPADSGPHCWVTLNGEDIQTAFYFWIQPDAAKLMLQSHRLTKFEKYSEEMEPMNGPESPVSFGAMSKAKRLQRLKIISETQDGVEKLLSYELQKPLYRNSTRALHVLMTKFLREKFTLDIPDLVDKWKNRCWTCGKRFGIDLKTCSACKWAKYCGKKCQAEGRLFDKKILDQNFVDSQAKILTGSFL